MEKVSMKLNIWSVGLPKSMGCDGTEVVVPLPDCRPAPPRPATRTTEKHESVGIPVRPAHRGDGQGGWSVDQGEAAVEIGAGVGGSNGLVISPSEPFGQVSLHLARPEGDVVFSDFHVKPVAVNADPAAGGGVPKQPNSLTPRAR